MMLRVRSAVREIASFCANVELILQWHDMGTRKEDSWPVLTSAVTTHKLQKLQKLFKLFAAIFKKNIRRTHIPAGARLGMMH